MSIKRRRKKNLCLDSPFLHYFGKYFLVEEKVFFVLFKFKENLPCSAAAADIQVCLFYLDLSIVVQIQSSVSTSTSFY